MLGDILKELRTQRRLTQQEVADALNVSKNTVYSWESGIRKPTIELMPEIADYFHVTTDFLFGREAAGKASIMPDDIAAHTNSEMSPEMKAEIEEIARKVFEKYAKRQ
ncbi:MAG: helix-turn-helix transcriptional regulator [Eubacteriales bacterium]|nr:helix-turn-helix transcriptional regulator [Eubacteriales bacterium]